MDTNEPNVKNEPTLLERSQAADAVTAKENRQKIVVICEMVILVISGLMTTIFFCVLAVETFPLAYGIPEALAFLMGLGLTFIAIVPGEFSVWLNTTKFTGEATITTGQQIVAAIASMIAVLVAAATSISTIVYFFPSLIPDWYLAMSNNVNLWSLVVGWLAVLICHVCFKLLSRSSRTNKKNADAHGKLQDAQDEVIISYAQGLKDATGDLIKQMSSDGIFKSDALKLTSDAMRLNSLRIQLAKRSAVKAGGQKDDLDALFGVDQTTVIENDPN